MATYRNVAQQGINVGLIVTCALIIWKAMVCFTGSESPVVVILTGSMEPGFHRGDILFLKMDHSPISIGEIVVYTIKDRPFPIVHRVIKVHQRLKTGEVDILTKGDGNAVDDRHGVYANNQLWIHQNDIIGHTVGYLPYVGMITIILTDYPFIKYLVFAVLIVLVLVTMN